MSRLKPLEHKIKAVFYWLFRFFFKKGTAEFNPLDGTKINKVIILRPDRIGDSICSFPLIDSLRRKFPNMKISIFASPKNFGLIKNDPRFDKIFIYRRNILLDIREVLHIRRQRYDAVIDLLGDDSVTTLVLSQLCVPGRPRLGIGKKRFAKYYDFNHHIEIGCPDHIIDINLNLLKAFGIEEVSTDGHAPPHIGRDAETLAEEFINGLRGDDPDRVLVGYNLSMRGVNRDWGFEKSRELIRRIVDDFGGVQVILISAPPDRHKGDRLIRNFNHSVTQVPANLNLIEVAAIIERLDLLISPDTSLIHIARSFKVPVIGLYPEYKKVYRQWRPYAQSNGLILSYGGDNVFNITVDQVYNEFNKMLDLLHPAETHER